MSVPIIKSASKITGQIEIVRSFSGRVNTGNYQHADFFCSTKATCDAEEAESISALLDEFVQDQVMESVREYKQRLSKKGAA